MVRVGHVGQVEAQSIVRPRTGVQPAYRPGTRASIRPSPPALSPARDGANDMHASTVEQAHFGRRHASHLGITVLPVVLLLIAAAGFLPGPAPVRAAGDKLEITVTAASKDGAWYLGGGPVTDHRFVDLLAGSISGAGTSESNDGWGTTTETLTLKGKIDPANGTIIATLTSDYSYVIDADNTWTKAYSGNFKATMWAFDSWKGEGTFAFGNVKRVGSVGNEVPAAGMSYDATVQLQITKGSLNFNPPETIEAFVASVGGDVEYSTDGGKTFKPLTRGTILPAGAMVSTGFDGSAVLDFGYGTLRVPQTVGLTLDEFTTSANLRRTQLHLNIGAVEARIKHTDSIRSDFSVSTPTANASIRGSAMIVSIEPETGVTTVWVTEDAAFVQGTADGAEIEVAAGLSVVIDAAGHAGTPAAFQESGLPDPAGAGHDPHHGNVWVSRLLGRDGDFSQLLNPRRTAGSAPPTGLPRRGWAWSAGARRAARAGDAAAPPGGIGR